MRIYLALLIAFFALANAALGAVGDAGVSDGTSAAQSGYNTGSALQGISTGYQSPSLVASFPGQTGYQTGSAQQSIVSGYQPSLPTSVPGQTGYQTGASQQSTVSGYQSSPLVASFPGQASYQTGAAQQGAASAFSSSQGQSYGQASSPYSSTAPQTVGPYQERMSANDLKLTQPIAESFQPDESLSFVPASPPSGLTMETSDSTGGVGSGSWYYPGSVTSRNHFYVQTAQSLRTVAGCRYGGYLPLWSDINSAGNFYVYEWYPGQYTPSVRWWGWAWPGFKKGWFSGDSPGWHILSYNCRDWSNYVYIYVYSGSTGSARYYDGGQTATYETTMPAGAPTPPDPNAESLVLPDFNLFQPGSGQAAGGSYAATSGYASSGYATQAGYAAQKGQAIQPGYAAQGGYPSAGSLTVTEGYVTQTYQAVYPKPSTCRCNEYYVQVAPGSLATVGGVRCGEWLPLWSKINRRGNYWSFEWSQCGSSGYCSPEVKDFGYKGTGWYQTWFRGNRAGWHVLSYCCNDWSNYIYVYVWPTS